MKNNTIDIEQLIQDFLFTELILRYKRLVENEKLKELYTNFLINQSIIIMTEYSIANKSSENQKPNKEAEEFSSKVKRLRRSTMKSRTFGSTHAKKRKEMGLDNFEKTYNLSVLIADDQSISWLGYEFFNAEKNFEDFDVILLQMKSVIDGFNFPLFEVYLENTLAEEEVYLKVDRDNKMNLSLESRSANNIFSDIVEESDLSFILLHFSRLKNIILAEQLFIGRELIVGPFALSFDRYISKVKAVAICNIGDDISKHSSLFIENLSSELNTGLTSDFFTRNRKVRNKIHYENLEVIDDAEYIEIARQQNVYISNFLKYFDLNTNIERQPYDDFFNWLNSYMKYNSVSRDEFNSNKDYYYEIYKESIKNNE